MSEKQQRFISEYLSSLNATDAARKAGYKHPTVAGAKLLKQKPVANAIAHVTKNTARKLDLKAEDVLVQLHHILTRTADDFVGEDGKLRPVPEMSERAKACIDGFEQDVTVYRNADGEIESEVIKTKIKLSSKVAAIDMAMKHKGLFPKEIQNTLHQHLHVNYDQLSGAPPQLEDRVLKAIDGPQGS